MPCPLNEKLSYQLSVSIRLGVHIESLPTQATTFGIKKKTERLNGATRFIISILSRR